MGTGYPGYGPFAPPGRSGRSVSKMEHRVSSIGQGLDRMALDTGTYALGFGTAAS